ncbi:MAG: archaeosortase/exosortase family protein [Terrimicrobiaceae bacterium]|nr:archaeosortase/exosortase family protein [Terrimicrobiaceae bacterium]
MNERVPAPRWENRLLAIVAWGAVLAVFAPSLLWLGQATWQTNQLRDAAVVLAFALVFLLRDRPGRMEWKMEFTPLASTYLGGACLLAGIGVFFRWPLAMVIALGLLAGALLVFLFGECMSRIAAGVAAAFSGLVALAVVSPWVDLPLRLFAGRSAVDVLGFLGLDARLGFAGDPPKLILMSGGHPFEVAPECNGFGITSSCILLSLLLAFSRRLRVTDKILVIVLAPMIGLFSNALRILVIVLLTPVVGNRGYLIMHEAVGIVLFLATLVLVWWLVAGLPDRSETQTKSAIS